MKFEIDLINQMILSLLVTNGSTKEKWDLMERWRPIKPG